MSLKQEKSLLEGKKEGISSSNPSLSALRQLIVRKLSALPDLSTDTVLKKVSTVKTKWEGPFIYEPPGGDLKKDWFVWLNYEHPLTGKMVRAGRYFIGFNQYKTKTERRQHGIALKNVIDDLLKAGWSPFQQYDVFQIYKNKSVPVLIDRYLEDHVKARVSANTYRKYKGELNLFKDWLIDGGYGHKQLAEIKKAVVTDFLAESQKKKHWSGKTYNHYLNDITTFFNHYHKNYDDYIDKVPTLSLTRARVERPGNSYYNDWQFKKLKEWMLENGDDILYYFCSFVYYAALRNESEGNILKAGDFNFKTKTLRIDSGTAKNRRTEFIPLYPDFLELLYELGVDEMPADHYIFGKDGPVKIVIGSPDPIGLHHFSKKFKKYKIKLGLTHKEGIYQYKHTRAVHLGEDGEELYKIMKLFRHKDLATTMIYMRGLGVDTQNTEFNKGRKF